MELVLEAYRIQLAQRNIIEPEELTSEQMEELAGEFDKDEFGYVLLSSKAIAKSLGFLSWVQGKPRTPPIVSGLLCSHGHCGEEGRT